MTPVGRLDLRELRKRVSEFGPLRRSETLTLLRNAHQQEPQNIEVENLLGSWLFFFGELEESYAHLSRVCSVAQNEKACTAAAGFDLARGRWKDAERLASNFAETACQASDRLWVLKNLLKDKTGAAARAEGLSRLEPDHEMSYLALAAAQELAGDHRSALDSIARGRKQARKVILLDMITWAGPDQKRGQ